MLSDDSDSHGDDTIVQSDDTIVHSASSIVHGDAALPEITPQTTAKTTPKKDMPDAGASGTPARSLTPSQLLFGALAETCQIDTRIATEAQRGELNQTEKKLRETGVRPEHLNGFYEWWSAHDWRGVKGQPPTPSQVREVWLQYVAYQKKRALNVRPGGAINMPSSRGK
jgi:hypothetical protein